MNKVFFFFLILAHLFGYGQENHGINWIEGGGHSYKISFKNPTPFISPFNLNYQYYFAAGTSCISDSDGRFMVLCNGYTLFDSSGNIIEGGDTITPKDICEFEYGFSSYSQMSLILPLKNNNYYLFSTTLSDSLFQSLWVPQLSDKFDLFIYSKIDMNLNGGAGKVVKKKIPLLKDVPLSRTQMMACRHADGKNWWLFKQARDTNMVYKFIVSEDSIYYMGTQGFAEPRWDHFDIKGQTMFSQDGKKYANVSWGKNSLFVSDFNRCSGELSNPLVFSLPINNRAPGIPIIDTLPTGVCFSPLGQFIYVCTEYNLYQLDLNDPDTATQWYHVSNMDTVYNEFQQWATIYPSPNGKLVIGNWNGLGKAMSVIENPDVKGIGCSFCPKCLRFPTFGVNNPPCMPNYGLGADSALMVGCWPVQTNSVSEESEVWSVYPNPAYQSIFVKNAKGKKKVLYNAMGQVIYSTVKDEIDVSWLSKGVYFLYCDGMAKKVIVE